MHSLVPANMRARLLSSWQVNLVCLAAPTPRLLIVVLCTVLVVCATQVSEFGLHFSLLLNYFELKIGAAMHASSRNVVIRVILLVVPARSLEDASAIWDIQEPTAK